MVASFCSSLTTPLSQKRRPSCLLTGLPILQERSLPRTSTYQKVLSRHSGERALHLQSEVASPLAADRVHTRMSLGSQNANPDLEVKKNVEMELNFEGVPWRKGLLWFDFGPDLELKEVIVGAQCDPNDIKAVAEVLNGHLFGSSFVAECFSEPRLRPLTPITRLAVGTIPSFAPRTAADPADALRSMTFTMSLNRGF